MSKYTGITLAAVALAVAGLSVPAAHASTATQGAGVQLLDVAGQPGIFPYGRPDVYIGTVNDGLTSAPLVPGSTRTYTMRVSNTGTITEQMRIWPAAASLTGGVWYPGNGTSKDVASSETSTSLSSLTLPPGGSSDVTITVRIPGTAQPGTSYGVVWAGVIPPGGSGNVTIAIRAGIREYLTVA